jgi:hypothetical protein
MKKKSKKVDDEQGLACIDALGERMSPEDTSAKAASPPAR